MQVRDMKQRSVDVHSFSMVPRPDVPRTSFPIAKNVKVPINFSDLVPIGLFEVLPGDAWNCKVTIVARTATPIVPIMDNWHLETFSFFVPNRLTWTNWVKFMGEQTNPGDSISYTIPQVASPVGGFPVGSIYDHMGIPTVGQIDPAGQVAVNALPFRAYNIIYNQWFRDQNLQNARDINNTSDGPDNQANYSLASRGKRHDYFTSALPWPQKGNTAVSLPLGSTAPVIRDEAQPNPYFNIPGDTAARRLSATNGVATTTWTGPPNATNQAMWAPTGVPGISVGLVTDLSAATAATVNQLRQSFQIQKLLERDARGGTRYTEIVQSHFGVINPDARLQRPEYIGGGYIPITTNAIPQTSASGLTGSTTPIGTLAATGHAQGSNGFSLHATEHGYIIVLASARADLTYQQGIPKHFLRRTRYDYYLPVFQALGEQAILNKEIYARGTAADENVFGYQERWAEYRYNPSEVRGLFRTTAAGNLGYWHSAQQFGSLPTLNGTFIGDNSKTVTQRNFAAGAQTADQQLLLDINFSGKMARPLPAYSVPGMIDHF